ELEPVLRGDVSLRDRNETRKTRFRRQKVVVRGVQPPRTLEVREAVSDGKDAAVLVVEKPKVHFLGERLRSIRKGRPSLAPPLLRRFLRRDQPGPPESGGKRHQGTRQVGTVDRGDVPRMEGGQALGVVPVQEVA